MCSQIIATFFLKPGYHEFLWQYSKYLEPSEADEINNLKLTIESIEIEGVDYADYECNNCTGKKSSAGSSECFYCKVNSYFDQRTETCVTCPIGTFSFSNAMSVNDCLESQPCSINDYVVITCFKICYFINLVYLFFIIQEKSKSTIIVVGFLFGVFFIFKHDLNNY